MNFALEPNQLTAAEKLSYAHSFVWLFGWKQARSCLGDCTNFDDIRLESVPDGWKPNEDTVEMIHYFQTTMAENVADRIAKGADPVAERKHLEESLDNLRSHLREIAVQKDIAGRLATAMLL